MNAHLKRKIPCQQQPSPLLLLMNNTKLGESAILEHPERAQKYQEIFKTLYQVFNHGLSVAPNGNCLGTISKHGEYHWKTYTEVDALRTAVGSALTSHSSRIAPEKDLHRIGIYSVNREE
jgi:hypothetical protein